MSPRGSAAAASPAQSTRSSSTPYSRRSASQPKSSRQQFSACGACRMRRVRCDLKDLPIGFVGPHPACSNCKERGIKCVDEFADVKAVKLLRRGRRLQQVEAIYGKVGDQDGNSSSTDLHSRTPTIPTLHSDFFVSPFWRWFTIQRPILDAGEFLARFAAHCKGSQPLTNEGGLIAMLLVVWAASFGLNEKGLPQTENSSDKTAVSDDNLSESSSPFSPNVAYDHPGNGRRQWKNTTEGYIREVLEFIDLHGVLRRPTMDGVRVLLLLLPLLEEAQPLERLAIYEATLSQVQALCIVSAVPSSGFEDAVMRARIFWYAYTQEGILTGIRGGRFVLSNEDLDIFQRTLPTSNVDMGRTGLPSPPSPSSLELTPSTGPYHPHESVNFSPPESASQKAFIHLMHAASAPLDISNICRRIHSVLTGIKATRRAEDHGLIDAHGMRDIWRGLDRCWQELESMKRAPLEHDNFLRRLEINQYVSSWQIFIFECHNVIRESLKHFSSNSTQVMYDPASPPRPSSHSSNSSPYLSPQHLHTAATRRCLTLLPRIIQILRVHTPREHNNVPGIFRWDAGLVRDGCFFAAYLAANLEGEFIDSPGEDDKQDSADTHLTVSDGVSVCLTALATMRWGFSKSDEREETIKMIWENRKLRRQGQAHHIPLYDPEYPQSLPVSASNMHISSSPHMTLPISDPGDRPMLPPLTVFMAQRRGSAPNTACTTDERTTNVWPSYTPPGTATSVATSTGTGLSRRGSPVFSHMASFKPPDDMFYHGGGEVDQFHYNAPLSGPLVRENTGLVSNVASYSHRNPQMEPQALAATTAANYMVTTTFNVTNSSNLTHADFHSCPQFGENCNGTYH
ncbi:hypothetical protein GALMADRAFT_134896 [Galerina marginata CBS 339.88]|uniref:Zn(2)-C6 fungal-type domain-containing protein n=1 Tax=Galerina marginata (strain CBS 339.88) TaxID=685588 RepID=A0A067TE52_GALM3|nr:hypothetical protein GALMADRAFT_134896 [Galerina marginata CBS 339.88]